jgi:hypothetical protein
MTIHSFAERHCDEGSNLGFADRVYLDCFIPFLQHKLLVYLDCFIPSSDVPSWLLLRNNGTNSQPITSIPERHCEVVALDNRSNLGFAFRVYLDCFVPFLQHKLLVYLDCFVPRSDVQTKYGFIRMETMRKQQTLFRSVIAR